MGNAIPDNRKKRGRPKVDATLVGVRIPPDLLAALDAHRASLGGNPSRPEAIRSLMESMLRAVGKL